MRMTTNFSRHIAKHEKKMDAISPELVHLLKEGANIEKPYPLTCFSGALYLIGEDT